MDEAPTTLAFREAEIVVCDDLVSAARLCSSRLVAHLRDTVSRRGVASVAFPGGSTPRALFEVLQTEPFLSEVPWASTHLFVGDERMVEPGSPESNMGNVSRLLASQIHIPQDNIHFVKTNLSAEEAALDYESQINSIGSSTSDPAVDYSILGLGTDGHVASLFPGSIEDPGRHILVTHHNYEDRPGLRITFSSAMICNSGKVAILVTGRTKAAVLNEALFGPFDPVRLPLQRILHGASQVTVIADSKAANLITHNTINS